MSVATEMTTEQLLLVVSGQQDRPTELRRLCTTELATRIDGSPLPRHAFDSVSGESVELAPVRQLTRKA